MADKPVTREEKYLAYLTGDYKGELPKPITRKEKYLYELCLKGIGGEISPEEIKNAVNEYLEKNPVKPGATTEQAQQIEQNKKDVASLKTETGSLKEDFSEYVNNVDGHFLGLSDAFEFGNITITESGWTYYTSTSRIRTKENFTLYLQAGAIIEIADSLVCYIGYKLSDGTYGLKSWFSGSYTVENDGEYVLLVRYSTESNIENILDIINGVSILVNPSADIVKLKEHTATLEKDIQNISSGIGIENGVITEKKTSFMIESTNVLDERKIEWGKSVSQLDGKVGDSINYGVTDYIEVPPHKTIYGSGFNSNFHTRKSDYYVRSYAVYDKEKMFVSGNADNTSVYTNDTDEIQYIRMNLHNNGVWSEQMLEIGELKDVGVHDFTLFGYYLHEDIINVRRMESDIKQIQENVEVQTDVISIIHGGTTSYPSNVLGLYKEAYKNGINYWECDVRPCSGDYVLCHDDDIYNHALDSNGNTIAQGTVLISESTVETLKSYKFGVITNKQNEGIVAGFENETIPTLREYLLLAKACGAYPVIEIKFSPTEQQMKDICDIVKACGMLHKTYILGYAAVQNVIQYALANGIKNLSIIINNGSCTNEDVDIAYSYIENHMEQLTDVLFNPQSPKLTESVAQYASTKGMRMCIWTIGKNESTTNILKWFNYGCTAFTTNILNIGKIIKESLVN